MKISKIVDEILIPINIQEKNRTRSCFVVFSSKEKHTEIVIDCIERAIKEKYDYEIKRLDESLKPEDSQYGELNDLINECSFGIVILDGLRPNIIFEYGIIKGSGKPCIVLLEQEAEIDIVNYFKQKEKIEINNPKIDIDKHFSDIKDLFHIKYNKYRPKEIIDKIQNEYIKLKKEIEAEFINMIFPNREMVEKELKDKLDNLSKIYDKRKEQLKHKDKIEFIGIVEKIDEIIKEYNLTLPKYYYAVISLLFRDFERYKDALKTINSIIAKNKKDVDLIILKSEILIYLKKFDEALTTLADGIKLKPKNESLWHNKGLVLEKLERGEEAKICYRKGVDFNEDQKCSRIHYLYGIKLYEDEQYSDALEQFDNALKIKSTDDQYLVWKAKTLDKLDKKKEAKRIIEEAIAYNENNADAWFTIGNLTSDSESLKYFDKSLSIDPEHPGALCSKAASLSNIGRYNEALEIFYKMDDYCLESKKCILLLQNICKTLLKNKEFDEALKYADMLLKIDKNNIAAHLIKVKSLIRFGKEKEALKILEIIFKINPTNADEWYNRSCAFAILKQIDESIKALKKAIELNPSYKKDIKTDSDFDGIRNNSKFKKEFN